MFGEKIKNKRGEKIEDKVMKKKTFILSTIEFFLFFLFK